MALEDKITGDIDCIYAAKLMAPYIELAEYPKASKAKIAAEKMRMGIGYALNTSIMSPFYVLA